MSTDGREQGFIVLHRRIQSSALWKALRADQRSVLLSILLLANWKPGRFLYGTTWVEVGRGELAHSIEHIAEHANTSPKVVRTTISKLLAGENPFLGTRTGTGSGTGPRILIIRNYTRYQTVDAEAGTETGTGSGTPRARLGHAPGTDRAPIEQGKQGNKETPSWGDSPAAKPALGEAKLAERVVPESRLPEPPAPSLESPLITAWQQGMLQRTCRPWPVGTENRGTLEAILEAHGVEACVEEAVGALERRKARGEEYWPRGPMQYVMKVLDHLGPPKRAVKAADPAPIRQTASPEWNAVQEKLRGTIRADLWAKYLQPLDAYTEWDTVVLVARDEFLARFIHDNYGAFISEQIPGKLVQVVAAKERATG